MPASRNEPLNWRLIIGFWLIISLLLLLRPMWLGDRLPLLGDDDMRMVSIAQWMNGGGFQDTIIWRDNAPYGASLHWSRVVDAPIAGLILLLRPFVGAQAESLAMVLWPVPLILALLVLMALLQRQLRIGGDPIAALVLPIMSLLLLYEFQPGRVDHHNVQIVLTVGLALAVMASRAQAWMGWVAGLVAATSLAVGMETVPFVVLAIALYGLMWAAFPQEAKGGTQAFAMSFPLFTLVHFFIATAPSQYAVVACDVVSLPYTVGALLAGAALVGATLIGARMPGQWTRFALVAGLGAAAGVVVLLLYPECRQGPYAQVDAEFLARIFPAIDEAMPVWVRLRLDPDYAIAAILMPVVAFALTVWRLKAGPSEARVDWAILLAFLAVALGMALIQIRASKFVVPFAVPAGVLLINAAREKYLSRPGAAGLAALVGAWILFAPSAQQTLVNLAARLIVGSSMSETDREAAAEEVEDRANCFQMDSYRPLAALPAGKVIAPIRIGPHILRLTPHGIVAAGFHRNAHGTLENLWFFNRDEDYAKSIVAARDLDYLVYCKGYPEIATFGGEPESLGNLEMMGQQWTWLKRISSPTDPIQIFTIDRESMAATSGSGMPVASTL